jgi:hypothetical protein
MVEKLTIREKTTSPITMQLLADGVPIDLRGSHSVRLEMKDSKNKTYRYASTGVSPSVEITNGEDGEVTFTPPNRNIFNYLSSPYRLYFWVYLTADQRFAVPEDRSNEIELLKEF